MELTDIVKRTESILDHLVTESLEQSYPASKIRSITQGFIKGCLSQVSKDKEPLCIVSIYRGLTNRKQETLLGDESEDMKDYIKDMADIMWMELKQHQKVMLIK